ATDQPGEWSLLVYGVILLLSIHFVPKGLMGAWFAIRNRLRHRRAGRQRQARAPRRRADLEGVLRRIGPPGEVVVDARGVRKNINGVQALDGIDFRLEAGTVHALIGPNGSGKTTFLNALSGFITADHGVQELFGSDIGKKRPAVRARL